ncbi:4-carboxymuconolactone decarboxylase [Pantoea sp. ICBG 828]|uniref:carboxymuconolactone decarboxylase family protein n=1 Tax=unclassified Pantoea TaxID=2630326 RepID=UPI000CE3E055|nr:MULTISPECIES: carboxymuconolactone decarboxylase family protein [unclassified Pantoea]NIG36084.1 4-carboxymuconolactone decarboxylase [Pantoea sp. Ap-959]PPC65561.1 4-carboxymuconolactone decarboxylase [Pantoea sp. ICBG 828]
MKSIPAAFLGLVLSAPGFAQTTHGEHPMPADSSSVSTVSPALQSYIQDAIEGDLWKRPQLSARDRSVVTVAVLIARNQTSELSTELNRAIDNGVKPGEISEIITHLAFYSGLANAKNAATVTKNVFAARGIGAEQLPSAAPLLLPLDEAAEAKRVEVAEKSAGSVSPALVKYTTDVLFRSLWLRPDLSPRDRSMVTVSGLIANGQVNQIGFHLNKAMDNGLTREQVGELIAQVAFYAGWPNAFSAVPVVQDVLKSRNS